MGYFPKSDLVCKMSELKIQTGGCTFFYILKIDSKWPNLYVLSFGSMYFVPLVRFSYAKVSAFSLYKLPIGAWWRHHVNFGGVYLENGSFWDKGPVVKNSRFFTIFPMVCSDLTYLEDKILDLLIGSRDFWPGSRDLWGAFFHKMWMSHKLHFI